MKKAEIAVSVFCIAFFSFMFYEAFQLRGEGRFGEMGSGFWPMLSLGVAVILSLSWLVSAVAAISRRDDGAAEPSPEEMRAQAGSRRRKVALSLLCIFLYITVMPWIGFVLSTFLFIPAFAFALEERRKTVLILSPFLITAITILVFARFITIPFPKGIGLFAEFSRLFY